jgi:hypothetical protein
MLPPALLALVLSSLASPAPAPRTAPQAAAPMCDGTKHPEPPPAPAPPKV